MHSQTRKHYFDLIKNAQASLLVTSHPASDHAFQVVTKASRSGGEEDDGVAGSEDHKCEVLCCKTPWYSGSPSAIHMVTVTQAGIATERCMVEPKRDGVLHLSQELKAAPAPEEIDTSLSLEGVKLEISA